MDLTPEVPHPRKRRFRLQFSLRAFLIVATLIGIVLAPWIARTRQQMQACEQLKSEGQYFKLSDPPGWLQFLPSNWLNMADGHWYRSVKTAVVSNDTGANAADRLAILKRGLLLIAALPNVEEIHIYSKDLNCSQDELLECCAVLQKIDGLIGLKLNSDENELLLSSLPNLPQLQTLLMFEGRLTDSGLEAVAKFPNLELLSIDGASLAGTSLKTVASLKKLKQVKFGGARFITSDLQCFANHPTLELFEARYSIDDEAMRILASCPNLQMLDLKASSISDIGLTYLQNAKNLQSIELDGTGITDAGFASLSHCKSLKSIHANSCKISDAIALTLNQLPKLETLHLNYTKVSDNLLPHLASLTSLNDLRVNNLDADIDDVIALIAQDSVRQREGWGCSAWQQAYYHFGNDPNYIPNFDPTVLELSNLRGVTGRIGRISRLANITSIDLARTDVGDSDLQAITSVCNLEQIDLRQTAVTPTGLATLKNQAQLSTLYAGPFDDAAEALLAIETLSTLTNLQIVGLDRLTPSSLASILKLKKLDRLNLDGCELDSGSIVALCQLPDLRELTWGSDSQDQYGRDEIELARLHYARETIGIPSGLQSAVASLNAASASARTHESILVNIVDERELIALANLRVQKLSASNVPLTPQGITALLLQSGIDSLDLSNTGTGDDVIKACVSSNVRSLILDNNPITDAAIDTLIQFKNLGDLSLANTQISDAGVSHILQSMTLDSLNISGTKVTARALTELNRSTCPVRYELVLTDLLSVSKLLTSMPSNLMPGYITTDRNHTRISSRTIQTLRGERPASSLTDIELCPELLDVWPIEEVLRNKSRVTQIRICRTNRGPEIIRIATRECPFIDSVLFQNESFNSTDALTLSPHAKGISFRNCAMSTSVLASLSSSRCLRGIFFDNCDLAGCSLKPLLQVKTLTTVRRESTSLTSEQLQTWNQLQSTLVPLE